jgi:hypothetical protein
MRCNTQHRLGDMKATLSGMYRTILAFLSVAVSAQLHPLAAQAPTATITGTVTDSATGTPLARVGVVIDGTSVGAFTDSVGRYRITNARPGTLSLVVSRIGYKPITRSEILVTSSGVHVVDLVMAPLSEPLGRIVATPISDPGQGRRFVICVSAPCVQPDAIVEHRNTLEILEAKVTTLRVRAPIPGAPPVQRPRKFPTSGA